ncbi:hypothetical protein [Glycomyces buryatensis]|uniref:Uncharacterized protein n=1 Tax=Glycomyces buryatensis TaxID=2570927 RepID=A0A4V4HS47_9ACTN|nr:hypothetical protein [Glycomyces buryatensis]THV40186.1 hypothetical protein FAB82_15945 [Glycomyces buryatensis]
MRTTLLTLIVLFGFIAGGCGSVEEEPPDLFAEYAESADVVNDPFPTDSCCRDRQAQLASIGGPDAVLSSLLGYRRCGREEPPFCELKSSQGQAARDFAGDNAAVYERGILVKDRDGVLEVMTLYVVENNEGERLLIDWLGETYDSGLADFQANNGYLREGDWILTVKEPTELSDEAEIVTVPGKTTATWIRWAIGIGIAAAVAAIAVIVVVRIRYFRSMRRPEEPS